MTDILPCPWCGAAADIFDDLNSVKCGSYSCDARGPYTATSAEAIAAWNRVAALVQAVTDAPVGKAHIGVAGSKSWVETPMSYTDACKFRGKRVRLVVEGDSDRLAHP